MRKKLSDLWGFGEEVGEKAINIRLKRKKYCGKTGGKTNKKDAEI